MAIFILKLNYYFISVKVNRTIQLLLKNFCSKQYKLTSNTKSQLMFFIKYI
ncbi:MAG: hypothetical protein K0R72_703 [Clostridia bacterium]|jgi:hypothetical protein|nr:hypothetical protein [Clostridia bacterium]